MVIPTRYPGPRSARRIFRRKKKKERESLLSDSDDSFTTTSTRSKRRKQTKNFFFHRAQGITKDDKAPEETSLQFLKRILRLEISLSAWDFDSSTLAYQLTLIDRDLFLKIPPNELGVLIWQQSSKNAPNIGALIAFSHRVSCLVATEILRDDSEKIRARLVARFINTAEKCNKISNYQSCRSVLCGLQSPPVYRLYSTWMYVRKKHATKYQVFEKLCRLYRDPRLPVYQKAFHRSRQTNQYLPYIGDVIAKLLDRIPQYGDNVLINSVSNSGKIQSQICIKNKIDDQENVPGLLQKFVATLKSWAVEPKSEDGGGGDEVTEMQKSSRALSNFYKPLNCYEDNRYDRLKEAVDLLDMFQRAATNYVFTRNELAAEYLLKARYREDRENFYNSFNVEPPIT
ncbi:guanine nucleotide exchange factor [Holotrichia oblita]|uniref:Guanine nucleotide exchange factor n=1 Tax=Holotrichia oblita TaxID=644536 RepID=A0ACB9T7V0_HOLOL|nr:guanine nucleotide exchange factor [Holotrichia oblita]